MTKFCSTCKLDKPLDQFGRDKNRKDGLSWACKQCKHGYFVDYYARTRGFTVAQNLADYQEDPDAYKAKRYARRQAVLEESPKLRRLRYSLRHNHNMTLEQYEALVRQQDGVCAICKLGPPDGKRLVVDHDHHCCSGKKGCGRCIRGLLCVGCNGWLGYFEPHITAMNAYLTREPVDLETLS